MSGKDVTKNDEDKKKTPDLKRITFGRFAYVIPESRLGEI
jgi:hypothetical protein